MTEVLEALLLGIKPDPEYTVTEWADEHRYLTSTSAAEPGLYRSSRVPFNREIMDCLSVRNPAREVVVMKGAQLGLSEVGNNFIGYVISTVPGPILAVQPTVDLAKNYSKMRIDTLIEASPILRGKVHEAKSREGSNTILTKKFKGGILVITGGNSAAGLRSMPVRYLFLDEIDSYKSNVGGEGSAITLAEARTATYQNSKKIYKISTPTIDGKSNIQREYEKSSMEKYHVPCPFCSEYQTIEWEGIKYSPHKIEETVHLECKHCRKKIFEWQKTKMLSAGKWIAEHPERKYTRGFHISSLYSAVGWYSWAMAAEDYEKAKEDPDTMRAFVNTKLGLCFRETGETPDYQRLYERREYYRPKELPFGACVLTAGIDVQKDRVEIFTVAWGPRKEKWAVDYEVILGDIEQNDVWDKLEEYVNQDWKVMGADLEIMISSFAIDSGFANMRVAAFAKRFSKKRCFMVKGVSSGSTFVQRPRDLEMKVNGKKVKSGLRVWNVLSSEGKAELYRHLLLDRGEEGSEAPQGFFHFHQDLHLEWFKGLCSEELKTKKVKGFDETYWEKVYRRNEPLDTYVYARAAYEVMGCSKWKPERWADIEDDLGRDPGLVFQHHKKRQAEIAEAYDPLVARVAAVQIPVAEQVPLDPNVVTTLPKPKVDEVKPVPRRKSSWL